jgi:hypothetical protein
MTHTANRVLPVRLEHALTDQSIQDALTSCSFGIQEALGKQRDKVEALKVAPSSVNFLKRARTRHLWRQGMRTIKAMLPVLFAIRFRGMFTLEIEEPTLILRNTLLRFRSHYSQIR